MVTQKQYNKALVQKERSQATINQYHKESAEAFKKRMEDNPIFTDEELHYSAFARCPCGHGMAYPNNCGGTHYWDCSAILKGVQDDEVKHTAQLPFAFYSVKSENSQRGTTRPEKV